MSKQERQVLDNLFGSAAYWQYRHNQEEYESQKAYKQAEHSDVTWIILLCILFTIGFLALLVKTTLWSIL